MLIRFLYCLLIINWSLLQCAAQSNIEDFKASENNGTVYLNWRMTIGITCNGINILHSTDSIQFDKIGEIPGICGSKIETVRYSFEHHQPLFNKINYYKLELGGLGFSDVIALNVIDYKEGYQVRPNPADDWMNIYFKNDQTRHTLKIYNLDGREFENYESSDDTFQIFTMAYLPGIYYFVIENTKNRNKLRGSFVIIHTK